MKHILTVIILFILALSAVSVYAATDIANCGAETIVTLFAGQTIDAGSVIIENDGTNLYVTFSTSGNWLLAETQLHVADTLDAIPHNKQGSPIPGQFDYKTTHQPPVSSYTYTIPLTWSVDTSLIVAAHASVVQLNSQGKVIQQEGAWSAGLDFPGKNWATYSTYTVQGCAPVDPGTTETAFAFGGDDATCFLDLDLNHDGHGDYQRWGWTNGPLSAKQTAYTFDLYAAAGQCDLKKGTLVGWLTVYYYDGVAHVIYNTFPGYTITETHLYVGNEPLALDNKGNYTLAPGQYPYTGTGLEYDISGLSGEIYIVAHAEVGGL